MKKYLKLTFLRALKKLLKDDMKVIPFSILTNDRVLRFLFIYIIFFLSAFLTSCLTTKPPEFETAEHIMASTKNNELHLSFDLIGHNPNNWSIKIKELQTEVNIGEQSFAGIQLDSNLRMKRNEDFTLPISIKVTKNDLAKVVISGMAFYLSGDKIPVEINGDVLVKKFLFRKKFAFKFNEQIDPKTLKLPF